MLIRSWLAVALASAVLTTGPGTARPHRYLADGTFDLLQVLPPAPVKGDAR